MAVRGLAGALRLGRRGGGVLRVQLGFEQVHPGDGEAWLDAEVPVNRSDFGLTWNQLGMSSVHNIITVHAVFTRA